MTQALIPGDDIGMLNSQSFAATNNALSVPHQSRQSSPKRQTSLFATSPEPQPQLYQTSTMHLSKSSSNNNTFVHKLYNMVIDNQFQHLIAWNYTGASFIVCNIMEFARDVLPKHFKHNNFSSFVRQLNMYGFHKVNKSPRGHRTLAENQIWEFSHTKFLRGRTDLLDEIKRKTMESDTVRRETDLHAHLTMIQMSQSDMLQQINHLYSSFSQVMREFYESKRKQEYQSQFVKSLVDYLSQKNGGELPQELITQYRKLTEMNNAVPTPPPIFVTDNTNSAPYMPTPQSSNSRNSSFIPSSPNSMNFNILSNSPPPITVSSTLSTVSTTSTANNCNSYNMYSTTPVPSPTTAPLRPPTTSASATLSTSPNLLSTPAIPSLQHQHCSPSTSSFPNLI